MLLAGAFVAFVAFAGGTTWVLLILGLPGGPVGKPLLSMQFEFPDTTRSECDPIPAV